MNALKKCAALLVTLAAATAVNAADAPAKTYRITLKDAKFAPADLVIPANEKVEIVVKNEDAKSAEFESDELDREKVIAAGSEVKIVVGPLKAGTYHYENEFHDASKGTITAK